MRMIIARSQENTLMMRSMSRMILMMKGTIKMIIIRDKIMKTSMELQIMAKNGNMAVILTTMIENL